MAFKNLDRLVTPTELDLGITFTARKKAQGELVGCVCATVKDCVAFVGPLAVDPKYQVKWTQVSDGGEVLNILLHRATGWARR